MANLSLLNSDLPTAEKLLVQTIHDCLAAGIDQTSPIIAELSLKLALVYSRLGQFDRAFEGFKFCTSAQDALNIDLTISNSSNSEDLNEKKNKIALIGMICNYFSKFLYDRGEYNEALKYSQRALEAARVIYTNGHSNCLCLMSDIAAIQMHIPEKQESVRDILFEAIDLVKRRIRSDFSAFKFPSEANTSQNSDCVQPREIQSNQSAAEPNDFSRKSHIVKKVFHFLCHFYVWLLFVLSKLIIFTNNKVYIILV
ncbi:unnamed protein product [Protopolystoma xenopodis]|uniref:MalT-like TPR region domain-containing protein n=1 Tax=Protopolystoma xenopodis TaxID=117903 RepID=A0A3S5AYJ0_9PLAT|nr:unnamed protein product [Protopolystoma xenopodis]